ncbi:hypothetical protein [Clostridium chauvoei]|uniref:Uncharacterized protein n=2 Tax=Clostridium chauvoei TaxID=46867 RepID=S6F9R5_9CLOT|nr:hypothetical protein [Clostridium chauvoei]MBX7279485.1 hypothetical protein [Clostridium chauvoei]MBX7282429.1 hypothetical protein [Clostridium chauvoei]MBX7285684.1 hypothetical protein [Clostridium chauvoei]MBX7287439.1 hypothetical protein [Clostridium chauvoei]MBX7289575.1 hypothetical protein [Clostridium chauvoei]
MNKDKIKELYVKTFHNSNDSLSLDKMEKELIDYYNAAGFDIATLEKLMDSIDQEQ